MANLEFLPKDQPNTLSDWLIRGSVACPFLIFGLEKFSTHAGTHWVHLFAQIGFGVWFRYCAGVVEVLGALLLLIPRFAIAGFILLACTMATATIIVAFVLHSPAQSIFPGVFFFGVSIAGGWRWLSQDRGSD